jgi:antitoxin component of MazEF toxin-antitoxin module
MHTVRIHQRGNSHGITIPAPYVKQLGWQLGQILVLHIRDNELCAFPLPDDLPTLRQPRPLPQETTHADQKD